MSKFQVWPTLSGCIEEGGRHSAPQAGVKHADVLDMRRVRLVATVGRQLRTGVQHPTEADGRLLKSELVSLDLPVQSFPHPA